MWFRKYNEFSQTYRGFHKKNVVVEGFNFYVQYIQSVSVHTQKDVATAALGSLITEMYHSTVKNKNLAMLDVFCHTRKIKWF
jgi:hypothetical protein